MCGICGIYNYKNHQAVSAEQIIKMYQVMKHRGPDDEGYHLDGSLALGQCRLSILDTSSRGRQPMASEDGSLILTFNGEIYNYVELRKELLLDGFKFNTGTDTEVIIQMYRKYGVNCLRYFIGMFAFALWDANAKRLFMARDRLGVKPFYYQETESGLLFGSEIKAILEAKAKQPQVNLHAVDRFMTFGYSSGEETIFDGVKKILPGAYMVLENDSLTETRYWDVDLSEEKDRGEKYYVDALRKLLLDASRIRLRSDVPLGVFLSGGLDSSAVVALLARDLKDPIKTFSVAYNKGKDFDETYYSRLIAKQFKTDHHEFYVDPADFRDFIPKFVWFMDEPVTEAAAISLYFIAKLAKEFVTVVLSGEGADEMLAGYPIYFYMKMLEYYRNVPKAIREGILDPIMCSFGQDKIKKYVQLSRSPLHERYLGVSLHNISLKDSLYSNDFKSALNGYNGASILQPYYEATKDRNLLNRMLYLDIKTWLVDDILIKADRMSMAASLELRSPFLDTRIAEFAATLPVKYKLRGRTTKYLLKKAMEGILPDEVIYRPKKGFPTPLQIMFQHELKDYARELLMGKRCIERGYFDDRFISKILEEHQKGIADHHKLIWQLVVLEEWHRCFIDTGSGDRNATVTSAIA
jgi:asparagine synthase (glutamine-hydrolysing)